MQSSKPSQNADQQELEKFERSAAKWWDLEGEFAALHQINPLRSDFIESQSRLTTDDSLAGKRLLDIGCGGGILSEEMARRGAHVTGIDLGVEPLRVAREHADQNNLKIDYREITAEALADEVRSGITEPFDIVTCMEMLEHVPDPSSIVSAAGTSCVSGGQLFFATINRSAKAYAFMVLAAEYVLNMVPRGTHDYEKFIRPAELGRWMRDANIAPKNSAGVVYNPFAKTFRLAPNDLDVNYMLHGTMAS